VSLRLKYTSETSVIHLKPTGFAGTQAAGPVRRDHLLGLPRKIPGAPVFAFAHFMFIHSFYWRSKKKHKYKLFDYIFA